MFFLTDMEASPVRCLVSAGPTREYFDPVRFVSNPSSGKMGFAIAAAAQALGWDVTLVAGPVALPTPPGVERVDVVTGAEMLDALRPRFTGCDILIMSAAVCDFRPRDRLPRKVKKTQMEMVVHMEPVVDILATLTQAKQDQFVVAFAAETNDVEAYARRKLVEKRADAIVANQVGLPGTGFEADDNRVQLLFANGEAEAFGPASKREVATWLVQRLRGHLPRKASLARA